MQEGQKQTHTKGGAEETDGKGRATWMDGGRGNPAEAGSQSNKQGRRAVGRVSSWLGFSLPRTGALHWAPSENY